MADDKEADHATRLEVDVMILDYLVYSTTKALLDVRKSEGQKPLRIGAQPDMLISLVNTFFAMFKTNHPGYQAGEELKLSLQLLKFVTLFSQRYSPCPTTPSRATLEDMRRQSALRTNDWLQNHPILAESRAFGSPLGLPQLQRNRRAILAHMAANWAVDGSEFFGTPASVSLLDLLPIFMTLSATKARLADWKVNSVWMQLAADFMRWSALEQHWIFGTQQNEHIDAAFAWGWTEDDRSRSNSPSEINLLNEMFRVDDKKMELPEWTLIRSGRAKALCTVAAHPEPKDMNALSKFEVTMISFLEGMLKTSRQPVLVQMELGKVEGMSAIETSTFKARLGWG